MGSDNDVKICGLRFTVCRFYDFTTESFMIL